MKSPPFKAATNVTRKPFALVHLRVYLWWSLCTLYLLACQVRVPWGDLSLCCVHVKSFKRFVYSLLIPLHLCVCVCVCVCLCVCCCCCCCLCSCCCCCVFVVFLDWAVKPPHFLIVKAASCIQISTFFLCLVVTPYSPVLYVGFCWGHFCSQNAPHPISHSR